MTSDLLAEVSHDVSIEPQLNELSVETLVHRDANRSAEARLDVSARGIWIKNQRAFFDLNQRA